MRIRTVLAAAVLASAAMFTMAGGASADSDVSILSGTNDNPCISIDTISSPDEPLSSTVINTDNCG
ncbi:hypothetical protein [Kitasatospora griseola]